MSKKNTRNNELLSINKSRTNPKIYSLLVKLVNEDREDLADMVLKIDYLLEYASNSIKQKDFMEAKEGLDRARVRLEKLKKEDVDTEYLDYLYEGIANKYRS